ncbi:peptidoglycan synthetase [Aliarcobacter skirrowii]|uniref:peptidoglycan synthetase n=1 Tax=Aliarcobacter skirrowii TaxID=28200 RepID=UPI0029B1F6F3|nr:peptidoglycan synthetase [Aliarcobacter skirrowii]MDX4027640.1 peptidoglycan synthetase [Aliarcobacter skirrowii]
MKISSIIDIVNGELLNQVAISSINSIKTDASKVKTADLFIAKDFHSIEIAIENGAYAIIFEDDFKAIDSEVAFIKVDSLELAILKIFRFKLANKKVDAFLCNTISYELLKSLFGNMFNKKVFILPNSLEKIFKFIDIIDNDSIVISKNERVLNTIFSQFKIFEKDIDKLSIKNLTIHSLFELSFSYKSRYFSRVKIAALYIKSLINCLEFFKDIDLDLSKLSNFKNLKALFLDKNLKVIEFGKSDTFLISQDDISLVEYEIKFIKEYYKYAKTIYITNKKLDFLDEKDQIIIKSIDELKSVLNKNIFNCAYIVGFKNSDVFDYFSKLKNIPSLF